MVEPKRGGSSGGVGVELAREQDVASIVAISNWAAEHTPANFATAPEPLGEWCASWRETHAMYPWLVARDECEVVGFAKASPHRSRGAYLWMAEVSVYVDARVRGRRIGTELYRVLIPTLNAQGFATLLAGISLPNPASERLHEAFGFVRCGTFHRAGWKFDRFHDVGYWELHLAREGETPRPLQQVLDVWSAAVPTG